ncbi:MAG: hypothetical protein HY046_11845, partial [Acidobacteria bacterium]|nr:hypothetical protein [Acidobacteriota bacterium]
VAEYNAYQACVAETNPAAKLTCFATFENTYPQSTLLPFAYAQGLQAAAGSNNAAKTLEFADKVMGLGDKVDVPTRFQACFLRANFFHRLFNGRAANAADMATKARASADECLALGAKLTKPETVEQAAFDQYMSGAKTLLNYTIGVSSQALKDYKRAVSAFQGALVTNPGDALTRYQLGTSYMQVDPPQYMDGFWSVARAIGLKVAGEAQVRSYLRNQLLRYQGGLVQCDKEVDAQLSELITLAGSNPERPADYSIPSSAEIEAVQKQINILTMMKGLKEGGKSAKITWLAACGLEFPELLGKVIGTADAGDGDTVQVYIGETPEEVEAATVHNVEVKVVEQPEAIRLKKDEAVHFSGHVMRYTPEPFIVYFDKGKVNAEDIPADEAATPKKTPKKAPAKAPAKKAPAKRPPAR